MRPEKLLSVLQIAGRLKKNTRHCMTDAGRKESIADHSWRMALMAMLLEHEPEFTSLDMGRVICMCLIHDLGEAFTGDIPTFEKTEGDARTEEKLYEEWVDTFPEEDREEWQGLLDEMKALETKEAQVYKALDKIEAVISHDESDIESWLVLEYDLQKTYGRENMKCSPYFEELRELVDRWTDRKINDTIQSKTKTKTMANRTHAEQTDFREGTDMVKLEKIDAVGENVQGTLIQAPGGEGHPNMIVIQCRKGYLMCGYLNMAAAEKFGDAAVLVGGADFDAVLKNPIKGMTEPAGRLGVKEGMTGLEAAKVLNA